MSVFEIQSPKGNTYEIEADSMPSGAQLQALIYQMEGVRNEPSSSSSEPPKSAAYRYVHGVADQLNPVNIVKGAAGMIAHPIDNIIAPMVVNRVKADEADKQGRTSEAMGYRAGGILPLIGPLAVNIGEQAGSGDIAGAFGSLTGLAVLPRVAGNAAKAAKVAAPVVRSAVAGVAKTAPVVLQVAKELSPEAAGAVAGAAVSGPIGGVAGAAIGRAVKDAVIKVLRKQRGISEAEAAKIADAITPEEAQGVISQPAKDVLPARFENEYKTDWGSEYDWKVGPDGVNLPKARNIAPIPPNKLPPVLPDPVAPEVVPATAVVAEAAARAARQKAHIAESYAKKEAKAAANAAADDDLLFNLERSIEKLKKRGPEPPPPSPAQTIAEKVKERVLSMKDQGMSRTQMKASVLEDILRRSDGYKPADVQRAVDLILKETR